MKQLLAMLLLLTCAFAVGAQQKVPAVQTTPSPSVEQQKQLRAAAVAWEQKAKEVEIARQSFLITLYSVMAELGLKPSETNFRWDDAGTLIFEKAKPEKVEKKQP